MEKQYGMKVDIKIQSISDVVTNSSTEVFILYKKRDKQEIKDLVNAILAIGCDKTFDDLFTIDLCISWWAADHLYENYKEISNKFSNSEEFVNYLETLSEEDLIKYEKMLNDGYDYPQCLYEGYCVSLKTDITETETLKNAEKAINYLDKIFDYECTYC